MTRQVLSNAIFSTSTHQTTEYFAEQTAEILHNIAMKEATDGSSIDVPDVLPNKNDQALQVLLSIPGISDVTAIAIMNAQFCSFQEFVNRYSTRDTYM